jgi:hypothetical protein
MPSPHDRVLVPDSQRALPSKGLARPRWSAIGLVSTLDRSATLGGWRMGRTKGTTTNPALAVNLGPAFGPYPRGGPA